MPVAYIGRRGRKRSYQLDVWHLGDRIRGREVEAKRTPEQGIVGDIPRFCLLIYCRSGRGGSIDRTRQPCGSACLTPGMTGRKKQQARRLRLGHGRPMQTFGGCVWEASLGHLAFRTKIRSGNPAIMPCWPSGHEACVSLYACIVEMHSPQVMSSTESSAPPGDQLESVRRHVGWAPRKHARTGKGKATCDRQLGTGGFKRHPTRAHCALITVITEACSSPGPVST